jgi:hypothetical protein
VASQLVENAGITPAVPVCPELVQLRFDRELWLVGITAVLEDCDILFPVIFTTELIIQLLFAVL